MQGIVEGLNSPWYRTVLPSCSGAPHPQRASVALGWEKLFRSLPKNRGPTPCPTMANEKWSRIDERKQNLLTNENKHSNRTNRALPCCLRSPLPLQPRPGDIEVLVFVGLDKHGSSVANMFENVVQVTVTRNRSQAPTIDTIQFKCALTKLPLQCHSKLWEGSGEAIDSAAMATSPVVHSGLLPTVRHDNVVSCERHLQLRCCWLWGVVLGWSGLHWDALQTWIDSPFYIARKVQVTGVLSQLYEVPVGQIFTPWFRVSATMWDRVSAALVSKPRSSINVLSHSASLQHRIHGRSWDRVDFWNIASTHIGERAKVILSTPWNARTWRNKWYGAGKPETLVHYRTRSKWCSAVRPDRTRVNTTLCEKNGRVERIICNREFCNRRFGWPLTPWWRTSWCSSSHIRTNGPRRKGESVYGTLISTSFGDGGAKAGCFPSTGTRKSRLAAEHHRVLAVNHKFQESSNKWPAKHVAR